MNNKPHTHRTMCDYGRGIVQVLQGHTCLEEASRAWYGFIQSITGHREIWIENAQGRVVPALPHDVVFQAQPQLHAA